MAYLHIGRSSVLGLVEYAWVCRDYQNSFLRYVLCKSLTRCFQMYPLKMFRTVADSELEWKSVEELNRIGGGSVHAYVVEVCVLHTIGVQFVEVQHRSKENKKCTRVCSYGR